MGRKKLAPELKLEAVTFYLNKEQAEVVKKVVERYKETGTIEPPK